MMSLYWAAAIKQYRIANGLSQVALADQVSVNQKTVSRWERGVDPPELRHQKRLRDLMFTPVDDIHVTAIRRSAGYSCVMRTDDPFHSLVHSAKAAATWGCPQTEFDNKRIEDVLGDQLRDDMQTSYEHERDVGVHNMAFGNGICLTPHAPFDGLEYSNSWQKIGGNIFLIVHAAPLHGTVTLQDCFYQDFTFDELTNENMSTLSSPLK